MEHEIMLTYSSICCDFVEPYGSDYDICEIYFDKIKDGYLYIRFNCGYKGDELFDFLDYVSKYGGIVAYAQKETAKDVATLNIFFNPKSKKNLFLYRRKFYLSKAFKFLNDVFGFSPALLASIAEVDISDFECCIE